MKLLERVLLALGLTAHFAVIALFTEVMTGQIPFYIIEYGFSASIAAAYLILIPGFYFVATGAIKLPENMLEVK